MSPKLIRCTVAALLLAGLTAAAPGRAFEPGRRAFDRPARTFSVRGLFVLLRELLDLVEKPAEHGGGVDPNGTPNGPE